MTTYIMLANYTDQGIRDIKDSPKRVDAARDLAMTCGVAIKDLYLTMGAYDLVVTVEAPDDATMARFALKIGSLGNVRSTTLNAFTEQEFRNIVETLN